MHLVLHRHESREKPEDSLADQMQSRSTWTKVVADSLCTQSGTSAGRTMALMSAGMKGSAVTQAQCVRTQSLGDDATYWELRQLHWHMKSVQNIPDAHQHRGCQQRRRRCSSS